MAETKFDPEAWLAVAAPALGFEVRAEWRPGILMHLGLTSKAAALLLEWPLDTHAEPGPIFRPGPRP